MTKSAENCVFVVQKCGVNSDGHVGPSLRPSEILTPKPMEDKVRLNLRVITYEQTN